jgi:hypothetical protein
MKKNAEKCQMAFSSLDGKRKFLCDYNVFLSRYGKLKYLARTPKTRGADFRLFLSLYLFVGIARQVGAILHEQDFSSSSSSSSSSSLHLFRPKKSSSPLNA